MQAQFALPEFAFAAKTVWELAHKRSGVRIFAEGEILPLIDPFLLQKKTRPFPKRQGACFCYLNLFLVLLGILLLIVLPGGCIRLLYPLYQPFLIDIAVSEIYNLKTVSFV